ncbi:MAG: protein kinase [Cyanobacteria bacterium P01_A01_bin.84]
MGRWGDGEMGRWGVKELIAQLLPITHYPLLITEIVIFIPILGLISKDYFSIGVMNDLQQHFLQQGYQVYRTLDRYGETDRTAYFGVAVKTKQPVIIEEFSCSKYAGEVAQTNQEQIQVLLELIHPRIGRFLESFETSTSICLVQEYKKATPLSHYQGMTPDKLKYIAAEVLDILIDLQNETPAIVHRNIRPENIWIDDRERVYLVGFDLSHEPQNTTLAYTKITNVFQPREQIANRSLNKATDLYALGVSIISLLTHTETAKLNKLINSSGDLYFRQYVPKDVSLDFVAWIEKLTHSKIIERYGDAEDALKALNNIEIERQAEAKLDTEELNLKAKFLGEHLIETVKINNFVLETTLIGHWEVAPNSGDTKNSHNHLNNWISINPYQFQGNRIKCDIEIDTGKLMASQTYERQLLLKTNSNQDIQTINLTISTPSLQLSKPPYTSLSIIIATAIACIGVATFLVPVTDVLGMLGTMLGILAGFMNGSFIGWNEVELFKFSSRGTLVLTLLIVVIGFLLDFAMVGSFLSGSVAGFIVGCVAGTVLRSHIAQRYSTLFGQILALFAVVFGAGIGMSLHQGISNQFVIMLLATGGVSLLTTIIWLLNKNRKILAAYNKRKSSLAQP